MFVLIRRYNFSYNGVVDFSLMESTFYRLSETQFRYKNCITLFYLQIYHLNKKKWRHEEANKKGFNCVYKNTHSCFIIFFAVGDLDSNKSSLLLCHHRLDRDLRFNLRFTKFNKVVGVNNFNGSKYNDLKRF